MKKLIKAALALGTLCLSCSDDGVDAYESTTPRGSGGQGDTAPSRIADDEIDEVLSTGGSVDKRADVRSLIAQVNRASRNVETAYYNARIWIPGFEEDLEYAVFVERDTSLSPIAGKIMLVSAGEHKTMFDGSTVTFHAADGTVSQSEDPIGLMQNPLLFDLWAHFLYASPFDDELRATVLREEPGATVAGEACRVVYVEYQAGDRARWYFARSDNLPRRIERLSVEDGQEQARITTTANLVINAPVPDGLLPSRGLKRFSEGAGRRLGHIYLLTVPISQVDFRPYLMANKAWFVQGGECIRLARALGTALVRQGFASFDPDTYERAARTGGPIELVPEVAASINRGALDMIALGRELLWLADVLPPATLGDLTPFTTTGTQIRLQVQQIWPLYELMLQTDPGIAAIVKGLVDQMEPIVEEQIVLLTRMLPQ